MKLKSFVKALTGTAALAIALLPATAEASPFTFVFNMPAWTSSSSSALFGTSAILDITVDNGKSTDLSQSYENSQITGLSLAAVGGTFSDSWTSADVDDDSCPTCSYVSTNASGIPTLDLLASATSTVIDFGFLTNATGYMQLAVMTPSGGFDTFAVTARSTGDVAQVVPELPSGPFTGIEVVGSLAGSSVPEPATVSLLGLGLVGLVSRRWRRS